MRLSGLDNRVEGLGAGSVWRVTESGQAGFVRPSTKMAALAAILKDTGGAEEDRTPDLRIANATLSQLSYRPTDQGPRRTPDLREF